MPCAAWFPNYAVGDCQGGADCQFSHKVDSASQEDYDKQIVQIEKMKEWRANRSSSDSNSDGTKERKARGEGQRKGQGQGVTVTLAWFTN
jgi:hypothetical protein